MELSGSDIKNFIIFSCTSGNGNPEKNSLHLRKRKPIKISYISRSGTLKHKLEK